MALVLLSESELPGIELSKSPMHPLETFDRWRRRWLSWLPKRTSWDKDATDLAPDKHHDWLLEPLDHQEASALFPHLSEESAAAQYQKMRLQLRELSKRGFLIKENSKTG